MIHMIKAQVYIQVRTSKSPHQCQHYCPLCTLNTPECSLASAAPLHHPPQPSPQQLPCCYSPAHPTRPSPLPCSFPVAPTQAPSQRIIQWNQIRYSINSLSLSPHAERSCMNVLCKTETKTEKCKSNPNPNPDPNPNPNIAASSWSNNYNFLTLTLTLTEFDPRIEFVSKTKSKPNPNPKPFPFLFP